MGAETSLCVSVPQIIIIFSSICRLNKKIILEVNPAEAKSHSTLERRFIYELKSSYLQTSWCRSH